MDDNDENETRTSGNWASEIGCFLLLLTVCGTLIIFKLIDKGVFGP